jgi:hypothetical protein
VTLVVHLESVRLSKACSRVSFYAIIVEIDRQGREPVEKRKIEPTTREDCRSEKVEETRTRMRMVSDRA